MITKTNSADWKSVLKADPTAWLLEESNQSVRYFTLKDILGAAEQDSDVKAAHKAIMSAGIVPRILEKQNPDGSWGEPSDFYLRCKYQGTVWTVILLAELGADGKDKRIQKAAEFILANSQDKQSGGFAVQSGADGGEHERVIPCLTGNMLYSLIRFGWLDNPAVQRGISWITQYQRFDDGVAQAPQGWPYQRFPNCWGKHTCHMGAVKSLKALAEIPAQKRDAAVRNTIQDGAEYLLIHHLYKSSHDPAVVAKKFWLNFSFPTLWKTDALEMLGLMVKLGYRDACMQAALDLLISKQDDQGRWQMEKSYNKRLIASLEKDGKPSKWVTLKALRVLKEINGKEFTLSHFRKGGLRGIYFLD